MSEHPRTEAPSGLAKEPSIELGALQESLGFFLLRASRKLNHQWAARWQEKDHRPLFYCAFALMGANPGISPAELARFLVLDKSRASDLIDTLEAEQSITRRRHSHDQRRLGIYLTPAGTARLATVLMELKQEEQRLHLLFSAEERRRLMDALDKIAASE
jgi:DNA-binding MarR family transcriptional regulator